MFCIHCGEELPNGAAYCAFCGRPQGTLSVRGDQRLRTQNSGSRRISDDGSTGEGKRRVMTKSGIVVEVDDSEPRNKYGRTRSEQAAYEARFQSGDQSSQSYQNGDHRDAYSDRDSATTYYRRQNSYDDEYYREKADAHGGANSKSEQRWQNRYDGVEHRNRDKIRPTRDKQFSKFLEQPLPFRPMKVALGVILILLAIFASINAIHFGALQVIREDGASGKSVAGFVIAALWVITAVIGFAVKFNKGMTMIAGVLMFVAAGVAMTTTEEVPYGLLYAIFSVGVAIVFLISGAGGVSMDGLE